MKLLVLFVLFTNILFANVGKIVALKGEADITRDNKIIKVKRNTLLKEKDLLTTKNNSKVQILFKDETIISIGKNSTFKINDYLFENKDNVKAEFSMIKGVFRTITGKIGKIAPQNFKLKTKSASIGIRGTQIITDLSQGKERIFCTEGQIEITENLTNQKIIVNKGEFVDMKKSIGTSLEKNKTKTKDLKDINNDVSLKENKAVDTVTKKENIEKLAIPTPPPSNNNTPPTPPSAEIAKTAATLESNDNVSAQLEQEEAEAVEERRIADALAAEEEEARRIAQEEAAEAKRITDALAAEAEEAKRLAQEAADAELQALADQQAAAENERLAQEELDAEEARRIAEEEAQAAIDAAEEAEREALEAQLAAAEEERLEQEALDAEEARRIAEEEAAAAAALLEEQLAAAELQRLADEAAAAELTLSLTNLTPETYYVNNSSKATYLGNFNSTPFDSHRQYLEVKGDEEDEVPIPTNTTISMDIDFGKSDDQITNGKVSVPGYTDLEFDGYFEDDKTLKLKADNGTKGDGGEADFFGSEANLIKGDINLKNNDIELDGFFEADKYDFNDLDILTADTYFTDNISKATYEGNIDNYFYGSSKISMDIDFGASINQITNGKIDVTSLILGLPLPGFTFNGSIDDSNHAYFSGTDITTGSGGADFYGNEANILKGGVSFFNGTNGIAGNFEANKKDVSPAQ